MHWLKKKHCRLVKSGVLDAGLEARLSKASAWAELVGYCASMYINATTLAKLHAQTSQLQARLRTAEERQLVRFPGSSVAIFSEISLKSPQKLFTFTIKT